MATFYFNAAVNNNWQTLGNWWMDDQFSVPATALPTSTDDVIASASITSNSGSAPTVANATFNGYAENGITITVTGLCTFNNGSRNVSDINGNCTFNDSTDHFRGTINGNCTFNHGSLNFEGTINGDCTFNDGSNNRKTINGNCTFNDSSYNRNPGTINGNCTFNNSSVNESTINGDARFNYLTANSSGEVVDINGYASGNVSGSVTDSANNIISTWIFNNTNLIGYAKGNCIFNNSSVNEGTINGDCTFSNGSYNTGTITGDCTFNDSAYNAGAITGNCTFNDSSYNVDLYGYGTSGIITGDCTFNPGSLNIGTITGNCTFNGATNGSGPAWGAVAGDCTFNDGANEPLAYVDGNCIFNGSSENGGVVSGNCTFNDSAKLYRSSDSDVFIGRVGGNCTMSVASAALSLDGWGYQIRGLYNGYDRIEGTIEIKYDKGINGSSILGIL